MTEAELTDPDLRAKRSRLDAAKVILAAVAAVAAVAALVVSLLIWVQTSSVTATISDCTTPTGQCYRAAQAQNAENRARLVDAIVAVQLCGRTGGTAEELQACVTRTLEQIGDR